MNILGMSFAIYQFAALLFSVFCIYTKRVIPAQHILLGQLFVFSVVLIAQLLGAR
jgi:hypothetical protein